MTNTQNNSDDLTIDPRLEQTLKCVRDPGESIHARPSATSEDVARLTKTLKITTAFVAAFDRATTPESSAGATPALDGVLSQDFFAFQTVLGQGGMGLIYNSVQQSMAREVAVKMLREEEMHNADTAVAFMREAFTTGALSHPNIVPVHFFGRDTKGQPFMVMKRVQGRSWRDLLTKTSTDITRQSDEFDLRYHLEIFLKVCDAVAFAHAHYIVHRDLKPGNVMLGNFGEVMVMDWGLAFDVSPDGDRGLATPRALISPIAGTPAYMAPEMVRGDVNSLGPATDIYLLGGILFEIVTGLPPHFGPDVYEVLDRVAKGQIDRLQPRPSLMRETRQLEQIINTAMATKADERYPNVAALQSDVRAFLAGQGDQRDSEALTQAARDELTVLTKEVADLLVTSPYYPRCTDIVAKTQQAITLWSFNSHAVRVRQEALALFADLATRGRDWGLAESLLRDLKLSGSGGHALAGPIELRLRTQREKLRLRDFVVRRMARIAVVAAIFMAALSLYLYWNLQDARLAITASSDRVGAFVSVETELEFASQDLAPWRLPKGMDDQTHRPTDAPMLKRFLASSTGNVLVWDETGDAWVWNTALPPATTRHLGLTKSNGVLAAAWGDGHTLLLATTDGELLTTELPTMSRDLMRPWRKILKTDALAPARALAARLRGPDLLLAVGTDKDIRILVPGKEARKESVSTPVLCLQYLTNGTLIGITQTAIRIWLPNEHEMLFNLHTPCIAGVSARAAPCIAVVPFDHKNAIHIFNLDLDAGKGDRTTVSRLFEDDIMCLALSADGKVLAAGSKAGELILLKGAPWKVIVAAKPHTGPVRAIGFNHDGTNVYSSDDSGRIFVWNIAFNQQSKI
ncbi:MAG: serine/threonine-protein kinase [Planctomycetota bacterium]